MALQALDSWKRLYSNSPANNFRQVAIGGLWNGADIPNSPNQEVLSAPRPLIPTLRVG